VCLALSLAKVSWTLTIAMLTPQILENPALLSNTAPRTRGRKLDAKVEKTGSSGCC
jgi:hypothetical protein